MRRTAGRTQLQDLRFLETAKAASASLRDALARGRRRILQVSVQPPATDAQGLDCWLPAHPVAIDRRLPWWPPGLHIRTTSSTYGQMLSPPFKNRFIDLKLTSGRHQGPASLTAGNSDLPVHLEPLVHDVPFFAESAECHRVFGLARGRVPSPLVIGGCFDWIVSSASGAKAVRPVPCFLMCAASRAFRMSCGVFLGEHRPAAGRTASALAVLCPQALLL